MRNNFIIRYYQAGAGAAGAAGGAAMALTGPVGIGIAAAQTALGIVQSISGSVKSKRLLAQRKSYQTPEEIYKILQAAMNAAQGGYDPQTLNYLTNQADRSFSASLNAAIRAGADPNQLSEVLDRRIQATFRIGAENQLQNMKNFERYIGALELVANNKAAEQKSREDLLKDKLQAAGYNQQAGLQNIIGGANTALATVSAIDSSKLYTVPPTKPASMDSSYEQGISTDWLLENAFPKRGIYN